MNTINYGFIATAVAYYESLGYQQIEVPWRVSIDTINITKPTAVKKDDYIIAGTGKALLASGEQGLLYLANKGMLPPGRYQTATPCFRNESYDRYHSKQFFKVELIELLDSDIVGVEAHERVHVMLKDAQRLFVQLAGTDRKGNIDAFAPDDTDELAIPNIRSVDLCMIMRDQRNIELGSYGARRTSFASWIYGTGLAEPRFSKALAELKRFT
jgi:hypothetical protein